MKIALMASGRGSNAGALLAAKARGELPACDFRVVLTNVADAPVLDIAREFGVAGVVVPHAGLRRAVHEERIVAELERAGAEAIVLAGYMRVLTGGFIERYRGRILNIHPSLLPAFPGTHAQQQARDYGAKVAGCTVHFVEEGVDSGPIIAQAAVEVRDNDTLEALTARILEQEHRIYPRALDLFSRGKLRLEGRRVVATE